MIVDDRAVEILTELAKYFKTADFKWIEIKCESMTKSEAYEKGLSNTESYRDIPGYYVKFGNEWEKWMTKKEFQKFQEKLHSKSDLIKYYK